MGIAPDLWVQSLRQACPYIHQYRGHTFVVCLEDDLLEQPEQSRSVLQDLVLLQGLGIRFALVFGVRLAESAVCGSRWQTLQTWFVQQQQRLEQALITAPSHTAMAGHRVRVVHGNFLTARPVGIIAGEDQRCRGTVRRVDVAGIQVAMQHDGLVLIPALAYAPNGERFVMDAAYVACAVAEACHSDKLFYFTDAAVTPCWYRAAALEQLFMDADAGSDTHHVQRLTMAVHAVRQGVARVHVLPAMQDGVLLLEVLGRDGAGIMVTDDPYECLRGANEADLDELIGLLQHASEDGFVLPPDERELRAALDEFVVLERDGAVLGCVAMRRYPGEGWVELKSLVVDGAYHRQGLGGRLLAWVQEQLLVVQERLFILTTRSAHWFQERGFVSLPVSDLPASRLRELERSGRQSQGYVWVQTDQAKKTSADNGA